MNERIASCCCGQLTARVAGEPVRVSICHCIACKQRTGSAFSHQARFHRADVTPSGASTTFVRPGDEGPGARFHFCPTCGANVYLEPLAMPDFVSIPVGAFADPAFPPPTVSVYEDRKQRWVVLPEGVEHHT